MGRTKRLIVTMPPRHGKSELISRFTPAWYLGRFPDRKVILASYSDTFAASWGRAARDVLEESGRRIFGVTVNQEAKGGQLWEVVPPEGMRVLRPGVMVTAGVGGGVTGKGANLMIIDDPVKNSEDAASEVNRQKQHDWWKSTARTRLQAGASVILVMTRWHEDDLAGRLLADELEGGDRWDVLNLPAFCEIEDGVDEIGRSLGDPLWPEMFSTEDLEATRRAMGNYWFSAMYQQRPAPADGNLFKRENLRYYERKGGNLTVMHRDDGPLLFDIGYGTKFCTVDVAGSSKESADFTVVSTWLVTPEKDLVWWDMEAVKFESLDIAPLIRRIFYEQKPVIIGVERLGFGLTVIQELLRDGLPIVRLEPDTDKVSRALPAAARTEEHRVFLPRGESWVDDAVAQMLAFPNAKNDDIVDTLSYAALTLPNLSPGQTFGNGMRQRRRGDTLMGNLMADML